MRIIARGRMMEPEGISPIMTLDDVAGYLKIHRRTVHQWAIDGIIPAFKVGNQWRFELDAVREWFRSGTARKRSPVRQASPAQTPAQPLAPAKPARKPCIVIAEDHEHLLGVYCEVFETGFPGVDVIPARDGVEALIHIIKREPCLIVADITMPRFDGLQLREFLLLDDALGRICFVAVSGTAGAELGFDEDNPPFDLLLRKPVSVGNLLNAIAEIAPGRSCEALFAGRAPEPAGKKKG
ncbi:MAG: helix-turn-helix domain-containing protein [Chitinivibrionales bacterium]|nr:helix-turn-helix domain-containing protein [Chitinivibrionales bacterium]MBD3396443.1 helix-turn-helix domain-containing protein [Chitinivibrionales bacterium]